MDASLSLDDLNTQRDNRGVRHGLNHDPPVLNLGDQKLDLMLFYNVLEPLDVCRIDEIWTNAGEALEPLPIRLVKRHL